MKIYNICTVLIVLLMLTVSMSAMAQVQEKNLVGWWLFDDETEETGNWGGITLRGATIEKGQLVTDPDKWANAVDYKGPNISEVSLVSWVSLDNLDHRKGSALTLDRTDRDQFLAIVYAERQEKRWMPGSSGFGRTQDFNNNVNESKIGEIIFLVITYKDVNGQYQITGYRDGENIGSFQQGGVQTWEKDTSEAIWGMRHSGGIANPVGPSISAHIEETRIYNIALTEEDIQTMHKGDLPVEPRDKLATKWAKIKRQ